MKIKLILKTTILAISSFAIISCNNVNHCDCVEKMTKWKEQGVFVNKTDGDKAVKCRDYYAKDEYADIRLDEAIEIAEEKCNEKAIAEEAKFNKEKEIRYTKVIDVLKDIRAAELAHLQITGKFNSSFDSLIRFVDTAEFAITQRRDTMFPDVERNRAFGLHHTQGGYYLEDVIIDTLRFQSVRDSLFRDSDRYKTMNKVNIKGEDVNISLDAGFIMRGDRRIAVFEATARKSDILHGLSRDLIIQEKQTISIDGVNGTHIRAGSMTDVNTNGNWPIQYDSPRDQ